MRDGASRRLHFMLRNSQVRPYCLPRKVTTRSAFASTVPINSGRELVCAKKNLKLISKRIVPFPIATPRGRRTYPENRINRWLITRRYAAPQAKPAVSKGYLRRAVARKRSLKEILDRGLLIPISIGAWATLLNDSTLVAQFSLSRERDVANITA